jgi:hypothetical protein
MGRAPRRVLALLLFVASAASSRAQLPPGFLPPPPPLPQVPAAERSLQGGADALQSCVPRHGEAECAARLYAQVLCSLGDQGQPQAIQDAQRWLAQRYDQAGIRFSDLSAAQIERLAVDDQVPQQCPDHSEAIRRLFSAPPQP